MVVHYKEEGELRHKSFVMVSDDQNNSFVVFEFIIKTIIAQIKDVLPHIRTIHYLTDSATSQHQNKSIINLVKRHEDMFGLTCTLSYFEAEHGEGPSDGVGGTIKRQLPATEQKWGIE